MSSPKLTDEQLAKEYGRRIWAACVDCGKERLVTLRKGKPRNLRCHSCATSRRNWKGGRYKVKGGYIMVRLSPSDFFYPMASKRGYVMEHRLVMAKHLNRCLLPWEVVHHKPPGIRDDNRLENLELLASRKTHLESMQMQREIKALKNRVTLLEAEITLLKMGGVKESDAIT